MVTEHNDGLSIQRGLVRDPASHDDPTQPMFTALIDLFWPHFTRAFEAGICVEDTSEHHKRYLPYFTGVPVADLAQVYPYGIEPLDSYVEVGRRVLACEDRFIDYVRRQINDFHHRDAYVRLYAGRRLESTAPALPRTAFPPAQETP
jgi:hypothetical protein